MHLLWGSPREIRAEGQELLVVREITPERRNNVSNPVNNGRKLLGGALGDIPCIWQSKIIVELSKS